MHDSKVTDVLVARRILFDLNAQARGWSKSWANLPLHRPYGVEVFHDQGFVDQLNSRVIIV